MRFFRLSVIFHLLPLMLLARPAQSQVSFFAPRLIPWAGPRSRRTSNGDGKPDLLGCSGSGYNLQLGNGDRHLRSQPWFACRPAAEVVATAGATEGAQLPRVHTRSL